MTIALGVLLNALTNHLSAAEVRSPSWWVLLAVQLLACIALVFLGIWRDDQRIGEAQTRIELLVPYVVSARRRRMRMGVRPSYAVTGEARRAWTCAFKDGLLLGGREGAFNYYILPEHMALVRHLLVMYLARFGKCTKPKVAVYGWLRLKLAVEEIPWEQLHPLVRDNPFSQALGPARPEKLLLPQETQVEAFDKGELLLRLTWKPTGSGLSRLLGLTEWSPGGEVRIRWLGPLAEVKSRDQGYGHLTARLKDPSAEVHVVVTRLVVEVETRWNALEAVAHFRDWGLNLARYLERAMDYWAWRQYYLERTVDNLDWKIGSIEKGQEPAVAERLRRLDERLARLEARLWPDEPLERGGEGAWLSGTDEETAHPVQPEP